jgi:hypothetical protein
VFRRSSAYCYRRFSLTLVTPVSGLLLFYLHLWQVFTDVSMEYDTLGPLPTSHDYWLASTIKTQQRHHEQHHKDETMSNSLYSSDTAENWSTQSIISTTAPWEDYKQVWHMNRPPLNQLVQISNETTMEEIVGDVRPLLDFAIMGHPKCATSFLMKWLRIHSDVQILHDEVCDIQSQPTLLVNHLYQDLSKGGQYQRGFKCPSPLTHWSLIYLRRYFRNTRLIFGVRHPIQWFER